ncbi:hypothetical protein SELMODRAFT_406142 [Selaginella moellendorffii]|uniref:Uncharacterized protein n=1 Tax=Selaginella moellendorffii TaxID=88036 RepID=D8R1E4_SELML|nr:hypothetical protein SELMODRAFT_406142 [Selaginella moellendorffii]
MARFAMGCIVLLHRFDPAVWEALVRNSNHLFTPRLKVLLLCVREVELDLSFLSLASPHLEELSISSTVQFKSLPRLARLKRCILEFRGKSESAKRELEEFVSTGTLLEYLCLRLVCANLELHNPNMNFLELEFGEGIFTVNAPKLKGVALTNTRGRLVLQGNNLERLLLGFSYIDKAFRSNKHTKLNLEKLQEEDAVEEVTKVLLAAAPNVGFRLTIPENDTYDDSPPSPLLFTRIVQLFVQRNKRRFAWPRMLNYFPGYEDLPTRVPDLFEEDETKGLPEQKMEVSGNAFDPARTEVGYRPIVGHFLAAFTSLAPKLHRKLLHPRPSFAFQLDQHAPAGRDLSEFFRLDEQAKSFTNEAVLLRMYGRDRAINQRITLGVLGGRGTGEWPDDAFEMFYYGCAAAVRNIRAGRMDKIPCIAVGLKLWASGEIDLVGFVRVTAKNKITSSSAAAFKSHVEQKCECLELRGQGRRARKLRRKYLQKSDGALIAALEEEFAQEQPRPP